MTGVPSPDSDPGCCELPLRVFFNNIQGFLSKRAQFLSCGITEQYDLFFLQETNVKEDRVLIDEWSAAKFRAFNLSYVDQSAFKRGTIAAVREGILAYPLKIAAADKRFEINAFRVHTRISYRTFVLAYRSPSMSTERTEAFFENLASVVASIEGEV